MTKDNYLHRQRGQSLIELVIAITIITTIITSATGAILVIFKSNEVAGKSQVATSLLNAMADNLSSYAEGNWQEMYDLDKGSSNKYHIGTSTGQLNSEAGEEQIFVDGFEYNRYFYSDIVYRDNYGFGDIVIYSGADDEEEDTSTQKVTIVVDYTISGDTRTFSEEMYLTSWRENNILSYTDWSGGPGQLGPINRVNNRFDSEPGTIDWSTLPGSITTTSDDYANLVSSIFDTEVDSAKFNTIMWHGDKNDGDVRFRVQVSDDGVNFSGWGSPLKPAGPDVQTPIKVSSSGQNVGRYLIYRIEIKDNGGVSPQVDDVIINYSE